MSDLISRKALLEELKTLERLARDRVADTPWDSPCRQRYQAQLFERERLKELVEKMLTAFDKEKVIEELNEKADYARNRWLNLTKEGQTKYWEGKENGIREAIEVVEKGGIERRE